MEKHAPEDCPRCGELFSCKINTIFQCECMNVVLTPNQSAYIKDYSEMNFGSYTCLCISCLRVLVEEYETAQND
jgi:hypothetical protein